MFEIKIIPTELTYKVRQPVLRAGKPIESCFFEGDNLASTVHFGLFIDDEIKAVVSGFEKNNSEFSYNTQYQLRGMAVLDSEQGKGLGAILLEAIEQYLKENKIELIWFNAREKAVKFYNKSNYKVKGNPFEINEIGIHYLMYKKLL